MDTLTRVDDLTKELLSLHRNAEGRPAVVRPARADRPAETLVPDLHPEDTRSRFLHKIFSQDPENLFDEHGESAIIAAEIISPSVVDNIKQAERGQLKMEYLMEQAPTSAEEARIIRDDAMSNPLYRGTLVSEDGKALCLYLPLKKKTYSYNVANLVSVLTAGWEGDDNVYITGLPVAEDTFGVEMLVQMATSAPMAGLVIFILLFIFFRRLSLIIAPMLVAILSVLCTMGLLIGLGLDVHIMSSMIAIFLMPIAVADSVHILSEFYDTYPRFRNKPDTVRHVVSHLFKPMLYTSLTTMAGFGSLGLTPIPPVRVFGLHVMFGVGLAWLLTMTFVPAYIMRFVSEASLQKACASHDDGATRRPSRLDPLLEGLGTFTYRRWRLILLLALAVAFVAGIGISRIRVNDNPVKWFTADHRIRAADTVLNSHFGGTYTAYLTLTPGPSQTVDWAGASSRLQEEARLRLTGLVPAKSLDGFDRLLEEHARQHAQKGHDTLQACFASLASAAAAIDGETGRRWDSIADTINYLDPAGLSIEGLLGAVRKEVPGAEPEIERLAAALAAAPADGVALQNAALEAADRMAGASLRDFVLDMETELTAPPFKQPALLRYVERLQNHLAGMEVVGKTSSAVDALKKAHYELNAEVYTPEGTTGANARFFSIPGTPSATGQVFTQLEGMKKKDSLFHLVTRDYREGNIWVQLTSGDNSDMEAVVAGVEGFMRAEPPPVALTAGWAGLTYINVIWQDKMVRGMLTSLASSFVVVLAMMMILFRSPAFGVLSMVPLSITIAFIYGLIGLVGKDYDMPVAVLSALTLGLSIDFAIHFLQRAREIHSRTGSWQETVRLMFREPAMAISRNAIVISFGFLPLLVAPLVPYRTVGFFLAMIMAISWLGTLFLLAALVTLLEKRLFRNSTKEGAPSP